MELLLVNTVSQTKTILSFGLEVGGEEGQRQHGKVANKGTGKSTSRLGPRAGAAPAMRQSDPTSGHRCPYLQDDELE